MGGLIPPQVEIVEELDILPSPQAAERYRYRLERSLRRAALPLSLRR